jgi:hypothetical protein
MEAVQHIDEEHGIGDQYAQSGAGRAKSNQRQRRRKD